MAMPISHNACIYYFWSQRQYGLNAPHWEELRERECWLAEMED